MNFYRSGRIMEKQFKLFWIILDDFLNKEVITGK